MAYESYIKIKGEKQGQLKGSSPKANRTDFIDVISFRMGGSVPVDSNNWKPKGSRQHQPGHRDLGGECRFTPAPPGSLDERGAEGSRHRARESHAGRCERAGQGAHHADGRGRGEHRSLLRGARQREARARRRPSRGDLLSFSADPRREPAGEHLGVRRLEYAGRLMATLLARLRAPERGLAVAGAEDELRASVLEHLRNMCCTRRGSVRSRPDYGLPDISELVHSFPEAIGKIRDALLHTIETYEPRLKNVRVRMCPSGSIEADGEVRNPGELRRRAGCSACPLRDPGDRVARDRSDVNGQSGKSVSPPTATPTDCDAHRLRRNVTSREGRPCSRTRGEPSWRTRRR